MAVITYLSSNAGLRIFLSVVFFLLGWITILVILGSMLKMHRSKSAVKKIRREYSFLSKLLLRHYERNCLHAVKFCRILICLCRVRFVAFAIYFLLELIGVWWVDLGIILAWLAVVLFVLMDCPIFIVDSMLARPIIGRFREYSFEKYHNTYDHTSLF